MVYFLIYPHWQSHLSLFHPYLPSKRCVFSSAISICYRSIANAKYIPVLLHKETKAAFLTRHLHFHYGDFYDSDNFFQKQISSTDMVLLYGFHNLYYIDFPFIDASWVTKGD